MTFVLSVWLLWKLVLLDSPVESFGIFDIYEILMLLNR